MPAPLRHLRHQGPVIAALGRTAVEALRQRAGRPSRAPDIPGPRLESTVPPRDPALVRDFIRHIGGDPKAYRGVLPAHLFPQFGFPLVGSTLIGIPYPLMKALNGGVRMTLNAPLPVDAELRLAARLESIDDNGRRALIHQTLTVGTPDRPDALAVDFYPIVPLSRPPKTRNGKPVRKLKPRVPADAREVGFWSLSARAGLDFALLTGDFNPIHWIPQAARAMGFKHTILHGFSTLSRAIEGLTAALWAGDPSRLAMIDVKFTRPLVLPAKVGLYVTDDGGVFVGDAPGGPAYLIGRFETRDAPTP